MATQASRSPRAKASKAARVMATFSSDMRGLGARFEQVLERPQLAGDVSPDPAAPDRVQQLRSPQARVAALTQPGAAGVRLERVGDLEPVDAVVLHPLDPAGRGPIDAAVIQRARRSKRDGPVDRHVAASGAGPRAVDLLDRVDLRAPARVVARIRDELEHLADRALDHDAALDPHKSRLSQEPAVFRRPLPMY